MKNSASTSLTTGRLVVLGTLVQRTEMSLEATDAEGTLATDGLGRPTLFGTAIAGALFDTMRRCGHQLPPALTTPPTAGARVLSDSCLLTWNCHARVTTIDMPSHARRQHVAIRQDSGAAAPDLLFATQTIAAGTRWPLVLEFDLLDWSRLTPQQSSEWTTDKAVAVLCQALDEWSDERCWLGGQVSRGLGWMRLEDCRIIHLPDQHALTWHSDLDQSPEDGAFDIESAAAALLSPSLGGVQLVPQCRESESENGNALDGSDAWIYVRLRGLLDFGQPRTDGWGLDTLSHTASPREGIHDHASARSRTLAPEGDGSFFSRRQSGTGEDRSGYAPDKVLALTPRLRQRPGQAEWVVEPFIAGSAIAGPIRHELSRRHRLNGLDVLDPVTGLTYAPTGNPTSDIGVWFGERHGSDDARASMLMVRDAFLSEPQRDSWLKFQAEHHAEDELRGSTYGDAKFTREVLALACFEWEMVLAAPAHQGATLEALAAELTGLLDGHALAIGGAVWRGHGRGRWRLTERSCTRAGERWLSKEKPKNA